MPGKAPVKIEVSDFSFENSLVRIVANSNRPEIRLAGLTVGPFEEGSEYEVRYWIARELEKAGIVRFREEDLLNLSRLHKIQWKERVQTARRISELPEDFYPKLRRYMAEIEEQMTKKPEKIREYEKIRQVAQDIINSRLKKIVSLGSASVQTQQILKNLTSEEKSLCKEIHKLVNGWRAQVLEKGGGEK